MRATRLLLGAVLAGLAGGPAFGQTIWAPPSAAGHPSGGRATAPLSLTAGVSAAPALAPAGTGSLPPPADIAPTTVLTGQPATAHPPGAAASPWVGSSPAGCCGPVGANGPMPYEIYFYTGPSLVVGGGADLIAAMRTGWMVGGGTRTLFLNPAADAAWVLDLGVSYTYNGADQRARVLDVFTPPPPDANGNVTAPEQVNSFFLRGFHRTSFNFAIGRDWFVNGPANLGRGNCEGGPNWRFGPEVGGRWGYGHSELIPVANQSTILEREGVYHGVFLGAHVDYEVPVGGYVLFTGLRTQWSYDWLNLVPPENGNIQSVNLLWTIGWRF